LSDALKNKVALITGATRGLGKALALEYANRGCDVILVGRNRERLEQVQDEVLSSHPAVRVWKRVCNLADKQEVVDLAVQLKNQVVVDILVNCAGVFPVGTLGDVSVEQYEECMAVNVTAPFLLMRELSPAMIENKWGRIINIASSSAYGGGPLTSTYCASKHALLGLSRSLYKELKEFGIRVQCVSPGSIQTDMGRAVEKLGQQFNTFMTAAEVAHYVVYNSSLNGNLVCEELRLNRVHVQ